MRAEIVQVRDQHDEGKLEVKSGGQRQFERRLIERSGPAMSPLCRILPLVPIRARKGAAYREPHRLPDRRIGAANQELTLDR